ncbi:MAG: hypothetical protein KA745_00320 [Gemmatimonadales bacterium]|nr:hypothetical protein [Gemmatimonadales bacterium]
MSQRTVGVVARMVAVASIKTREASAGRLSHERRATANEKSGTTNAVPQRVRALYVRCAECAKALTAIAQTAAVLDSRGRRERELESENGVNLRSGRNAALGRRLIPGASEAVGATEGGAEAALAR